MLIEKENQLWNYVLIMDSELWNVILIYIKTALSSFYVWGQIRQNLVYMRTKLDPINKMENKKYTYNDT
jgi:hypothetical protein